MPIASHGPPGGGSYWIWLLLEAEYTDSSQDHQDQVSAEDLDEEDDYELESMPFQDDNEVLDLKMWKFHVLQQLEIILLTVNLIVQFICYDKQQIKSQLQFSP